MESISFLGGVIVAWIPVVANIITIKNENRNKYIDQINSERLRWLRHSKEIVPQYCASVLECFEYINAQKGVPSKNKFDKKNLELKKECFRLDNELKLYLNPNEYEEISQLITNITKGVIHDGKLELTDLEDLNKKYSIMLKDEWEHMKEEAAKGKNNSIISWPRGSK